MVLGAESGFGSGAKPPFPRQVSPPRAAPVRPLAGKAPTFDNMYDQWLHALRSADSE
ncbi:MAG: hypothetical protein ACK4RK_17870 [Gemmataceae bacterium]